MLQNFKSKCCNKNFQVITIFHVCYTLNKCLPCKAGDIFFGTPVEHLEFVQRIYLAYCSNWLYYFCGI